MSGVLIRAMTAADWAAVESIYREGIATGNATFETDPANMVGLRLGETHPGAARCRGHRRFDPRMGRRLARVIS